LEDWNPLDGLDEPLVMTNMGGADNGADQAGASGRGEAGAGESAGAEVTMEQRRLEVRQDRVKTMNRYVRLWEETIGRVVKRETADIRRAVPKLKKDRQAFEEWLATFYEELQDAIPGYFDGLMNTYAEQIFEGVGEELKKAAPQITPEMETWIATYLVKFAAGYAVGGEKQLRTLLAEAEDDEAAAEAILERMDGWEETRASKSGMQQAFEAGNALAIAGYRQRNVKQIVWVGGDCPLCAQFNGRVIGIEETFATAGDTVDAEDGVTASLPITKTISHGPLHGGCDCTIQAG